MTAVGGWAVVSRRKMNAWRRGARKSMASMAVGGLDFFFVKHMLSDAGRMPISNYEHTRTAANFE